MTQRKKISWWISAAIITILVWCCNLGGSWWSLNAPWYSVLATSIYLIFWSAFTWAARGHTKIETVLLIISVLHLLSALCSLLVRLIPAWFLPASLSGWFIASALITPFASGVVFYGLSAFAGRDWTAMYAVATLLCAGWVLWCTSLRRKF